MFDPLPVPPINCMISVMKLEASCSENQVLPYEASPVQGTGAALAWKSLAQVLSYI